jgi:multidrug efflux system membrane fusion protein
MKERDMTITQRQADGGADAPAQPQGTGWQEQTKPPRPPRRWLGWVVLFLVAAAGYWAWGHMRHPAGAPSPSEQVATAAKGGRRGPDTGPAPVGVATVGTRDVHVVINALGTVTPLATVTVVSQISGYLQDVAFTEGQHVKKGDFLAQIDPRPYQTLKAQYEGQLAHDQGLLNQAKSDDERYQTLLKQNSIAAQTAQNQKYVVQQYEGTVRADQAQIDAQNLNLTYAHIVSPVEGRIGLRLVDPGNYVTAGSASGVAVITKMQPISVLFSVPEDAIDQILPRIRDGAKLVAEAYDRANVKKLGTGAVSVLDNQVDTTTGMVKLRAVFDNADEALFPNQFVNIRLLVTTLENAVAAPTAAVQHGAPGDYVYAVKDGKAAVHVVKLGVTDGDYVQILSGLSAGDAVVIDGADRLREGAEVRVVADGSSELKGAGKRSNAPQQ